MMRVHCDCSLLRVQTISRNGLTQSSRTPTGVIRNIEYTYTTEGRLATRTWSRKHAGNRIVTVCG